MQQDRDREREKYEQSLHDQAALDHKQILQDTETDSDQNNDVTHTNTKTPTWPALLQQRITRLLYNWRYLDRADY